MDHQQLEMYYTQSSSGMSTEQGRFPINFRRRKERDKVSEVWKTFYVSPIEPNSVVCRLCSVTLSYVGGSTSGMRNHLQNKHRHIIPKAFSSSSASGSSESSNRLRERSGESFNNPISNTRFSSESYPVPSVSPPAPQSQFNHASSCFPVTSTQNNSSSSPTCLSPPSPYPGNGENNSGLVSTRLAREVAVMCATDLLSPTLVDGKGFHRIFRLLSGSAQSTDISNITSQAVRSAMKDLQFSLRLKIQRQLSSCTRIPKGEFKNEVAPKRRPLSLILCPWTHVKTSSSSEAWDNHVESAVIQFNGYVDVRAQFLGDDWHPESRLLGTLPFPTATESLNKQELKSSAEGLAVAIRHLISTTYELTDGQIVACVHPKCPILDACMESFSWSSVPCVAHILDKVVENAFNSSCDVSKTDTDAATNSNITTNADNVNLSGTTSGNNTSIPEVSDVISIGKILSVKDVVAVGVEMLRNEKSLPGNSESSETGHENDSVDSALENLHKLNEKELQNSIFGMRNGRWRVWCRVLEQLNEVNSVKDLRYSDWKRNLTSLLPTIIRLGTAWEALSSSIGPSMSDEIPLLSCALPVLCSLPFCPSLGDCDGNDCDVGSPVMQAEESTPLSNENPESSKKSADSKHKSQESDSGTIGQLVRHKLKTSLDSVLKIGKVEELKGAALLMALASFVDPRHKALLFLSAAQREEIQQEVLRQMSAEDCVVQTMDQKNRYSPKSGDARKRTSSLESMNSSYYKRSKLEDLLHGVFGYSTAPDFTDISHEIEHYIGEPIAPLSQVPGIWWRQRESKYPRLSQMARRLLTIPASVSTGRGGLSTLHLPSEDITSVLFLHSNLTVSDLEEMGFEIEGDEEGWRKHQKVDKEEEDRDDGMDVREDETKDYDDSGRVVDEEQFYEVESACRDSQIIKVEPVCLTD